MVKHGRTKKRRAGRIGKVKLKQRTWTRHDPNPKIDKTLKPLWDPSKSAALNLQNIGLLAKPNDDAIQRKGKKKTGETSASTNFIELFDVPDSDAPSRRDLYPLTEDEEKYIAKCMAKYGCDYTRMFRDTKINKMQHTEDKLRKWGARYLLLTPSQRRIEVPDKVKPLLPQSQS